MSKTEYHPDATGGGGLWTVVVMFLCLLALLHFGAMVVLGGAGVLLWRWIDCRQPLGKRHLLLLFALSLVPALLVSKLAHGNPIMTYIEVQQDVLDAGVRRAFHHSPTFDAGVSVLGYLARVLPTWLPGAVVSGTIIGRMTRPKKSPLLVREATGVELPRKVEKQLAKGLHHPEGGWTLGLNAKGKPVAISDAEARQHTIVCGATGSGKTTVICHLLDGVAPRAPVVIVDCKASAVLRQRVAALPGSVIWTIGGRTRWDALRGDSSCFASKLLAAESYSPDAAVYRAAAHRYLQWVGDVLDLAHAPRDPMLVAELLTPKALLTALRPLAATYRDHPQISQWLKRLARQVEGLGETELKGLAGFASRYGAVVEGAVGRGLGTGADALVLEQAISDGRTVLFSLDAATYPLEAAKVGAWALLDLVRVAGLMQAHGWGSDRQAYFVVDEFSALGYEGRHVVPVLARAREAGIGCVVATQGLADLARVDAALPQQIVQNAAVRVLLRQGSAEDATAWARHGGEFEREELSRRLENGWLGDRDTGVASTGWRREFYVSPDELRVLGTGDAVLWIAPVGRQKRRIERFRVAPASPLAPISIAGRRWYEPVHGQLAA